MIEYKGASIEELSLKKIKTTEEEHPSLFQADFSPSEEEILKKRDLLFLKMVDHLKDIKAFDPV